MQIKIKKGSHLDQDYELEIRPITILLGDNLTDNAESDVISDVIKFIKNLGFIAKAGNICFDFLDNSTLEHVPYPTKGCHQVSGVEYSNEITKIYFNYGVETHFRILHPKAHFSLAQCYADAIIHCKNEGKDRKFIIQTYSENMLLRFRRLIAEGELLSSDFVIYLFENVDGETQIQTIMVDESGTLSDWQEGLFTENVQEILAIRKAVKNKILKQ